MFWIVRQSCGPSDRPGCESKTTQSCPVWVCGEAVTEEHRERWTGGSAACRVPRWQQTGHNSVSCFFSISKSSAFLTWMVRHSQAVLIVPWCDPALGAFPGGVEKCNWGFSHFPEATAPDWEPPPCPHLPSVVLLLFCPAGAESALGPSMDFLMELQCCPRCWAHTGSPACHSHKTRLYVWISSP